MVLTSVRASAVSLMSVRASRRGAARSHTARRGPLFRGLGAARSHTARRSLLFRGWVHCSVGSARLILAWRHPVGARQPALVTAQHVAHSHGSSQTNPLGSLTRARLSECARAQLVERTRAWLGSRVWAWVAHSCGLGSAQSCGLGWARFYVCSAQLALHGFAQGAIRAPSGVIGFVHVVTDAALWSKVQTS